MKASWEFEFYINNLDLILDFEFLEDEKLFKNESFYYLTQIKKTDNIKNNDESSYNWWNLWWKNLNIN